MTRAIAIKGYRISKAGRIEQDPRRLSVSKRLQVQSSRKVRVAKRVIRKEASP